MKNPIAYMHDYFLGEVIAESRSSGASIRVIKKPAYRELLYNNTVFSRIMNDRLLTNSYWDYFLPLPALFANPKILIIGLGGGTIPYQMEETYKSASIDVVEINKDMVKMSESFIGRRLSSNIIIGDGMKYMRDSKGVYDIIIADAYINDDMPEEFFSRSLPAIAYGALKERGILAINYTLTSYGEANSKKLIKGLKEKFLTYALATPITQGNRIIICAKNMERNIISSKAAGSPIKEKHEFISNAYSSMQEIP